MLSINLEEIKHSRFSVSGTCAGVYFLYNNDDLVYVGQTWNCFLRVAEHTRKDGSRFKEFTSWSFIPLEDQTQRKDLERKLIREYQPIYNRI